MHNEWPVFRVLDAANKTTLRLIELRTTMSPVEWSQLAIRVTKRMRDLHEYIEAAARTDKAQRR